MAVLSDVMVSDVDGARDAVGSDVADVNRRRSFDEGVQWCASVSVQVIIASPCIFYIGNR